MGYTTIGEQDAAAQNALYTHNNELNLRPYSGMDPRITAREYSLFHEVLGADNTPYARMLKSLNLKRDIGIKDLVSPIGHKTPDPLSQSDRAVSNISELLRLPRAMDYML